MARTPEGKVKDEAVKVIKFYGAYYFFVPQNGYGRSGVPDIIVCYKGRFLGVECKAGKNVATTLQQREITAIHKAGGSAMVLYEDMVPLIEWFERNDNVNL
jgi:Holliday junction resolvase